MAQNGAGQSDWRIFKSNIALEKMMKKPDFLHVVTNSFMEIKI